MALLRSISRMTSIPGEHCGVQRVVSSVLDRTTARLVPVAKKYVISVERSAIKERNDRNAGDRSLGRGKRFLPL